MLRSPQPVDHAARRRDEIAASRTVTSLKSSSRWRKRSKRFHLASSSS
jgi:hypothetical protein